ncbi:MAG: Tad domain-containing protein [Ardenticatenaceae bacterium]|nr:Tad domain-containing protein [Ardenticatenaceae bacterium]
MKTNDTQPGDNRFETQIDDQEQDAIDSIPEDHQSSTERGQAIVLIAAAIVVLLGFAGLAVDGGMVWVRDAQLTAAVDSAALAGAPEISNGGLPAADEKAAKFLYSNYIPGATIDDFTSSTGTTELGERQYSITATWGVDLYFMSLFGFDVISVTRSATAAYFPLTDIYASARVEDGALTTSNQAVFGPQICTSYGDPYSPFNSPWAPGEFSYRYRIYIPADYETASGTSLVRVEIFDADSMNSNVNDSTLLQTERWLAANPGEPDSRTVSCTSNQKNPCVIHTCEWDQADGGGDDASGSCSGGLTTFDDENLINPFWFVRMDENRGSGGGSGNNSCGQPGNYTVEYNTATEFDLYYFQERNDGTLIRTPLASYTGQSGNKTGGMLNSDYDSFDHGTDMNWASPGAPNVFGNVMTDCGSPTGGYVDPNDPGRCPPGPRDTPPGPGEGFEIDLSQDVSNIVVDDTSGARYIYLDVTTIGGSSENGFELWAGPPSQSANLPADGNLRNVVIANNTSNGVRRTSFGVSVFAMGTLPMNSAATMRVAIPLIYVPAEYAGRTVSISLFDTDSGTRPPAYFYFDSISRNDYEINYPQSGVTTCFRSGSSCNNRWVGDPLGGGSYDPIQIQVPSLNELCTDPSNPSQVADCTPFYGGVLYVEYQAGKADTYIWEASLPSFPYLVR